MKTITITLYTLKELKQRAKPVYNKLYQKWRDLELQYPSPWYDEVIDSLKAWCKLLDFRITNYNIGGYGYPYVDIQSIYDGDESASEDLYGARAIAYIMNRLDSYTIPYGCKHKDYKKYMRYGKAYRAGKIEPCPLTGYYTDDLFIDKTIASVKAGWSLQDAIYSLGKVAADELESDREQQCSEESFLLNNEDKYFTIDGVELCTST